MDEYLFITLAKLKADRLRLEREQRARMQEEPRKEPVATHRDSAQIDWLSREPQWRQQS